MESFYHWLCMRVYAQKTFLGDVQKTAPSETRSEGSGAGTSSGFPSCPSALRRHFHKSKLSPEHRGPPSAGGLLSAGWRGLGRGLSLGSPLLSRHKVSRGFVTRLWGGHSRCHLHSPREGDWNKTSTPSPLTKGDHKTNKGTKP